jgi:hypothetical protein
VGTGGCKGFIILVEADELTVIIKVGKYLRSVTAAAERGVNIDTA